MVNYWDRVQKHVQNIEASGDLILMDKAAFILGSGSEFIGYYMDHITKDCPKIQVLVNEMDPIKIRPMYGLFLSEFMDREDDLGYMADTIRKILF